MTLPQLTDAQWSAFRKTLLKFARIQLPDRPELAEDLVQETMLSAYRAADLYKGDAQIGSWLFAILKNKITDSLRRIGKQREIFVSPQEEELDNLFEERFSADGHWTSEGEPDVWTSPDGVLANKEFYEILEACLYHLPENTARIFTMKEVLGMPSEEIRSQCGLTASNYHTIMHRAREGLRQCLQIKWFNDRG